MNFMRMTLDWFLLRDHTMPLTEAMNVIIISSLYFKTHNYKLIIMYGIKVMPIGLIKLKHCYLHTADLRTDASGVA